MKRRTRLLKQTAIESLTLAVEIFNRSSPTARTQGVLLNLHHSFELLFKATIWEDRGRIEPKGGGNSHSLRECLGILRGMGQLGEDEAIVAATIAGHRDAVQHQGAAVTEERLSRSRPRKTRPRLWESASDARAALDDAWLVEGDRYCLDRSKIRIDLDQLDQLLASTTPDSETEPQTLEAALALWRGEPLEGSDYAWADGHIHRLQATLIGLLERAGNARLQRGDARGALALAEQAITLDQFHEASWRLALQADHALGLRESITRRYNDLERALDQQLGLQPSQPRDPARVPETARTGVAVSVVGELVRDRCRVRARALARTRRFRQITRANSDNLAAVAVAGAVIGCVINLALLCVGWILRVQLMRSIRG